MFAPYMHDTMHTHPIELLPCSAIQPDVGMAMVMSGGLLVKATGTTKPTYVSVTRKEAACTAGDLIQVIRVDPGAKFMTAFGADAKAIKVGDKVTIGTDAMTVTATTTDGVAEVVQMMGNASGSECIVRIP